MMANIFGGSEIVEMGIQIEKNGMDFYEVLAEQSKNKKANEIFKFLEGEEEKHIAAFQKIFDSVKMYEPPESYPGEYFAYMKSLADEHVFTKKDMGKEIARKTRGDKEAVRLGIKFEKDSITFYEGMKKVVPENQHKIIDALIAEENGHLLKLSGLRDSL